MKIRSYCVPAMRVVSAFAKKYNLNRIYIWDVIEDQFNIIRYMGCVMTQDQINLLEEILLEENEELREEK